MGDSVTSLSPAFVVVQDNKPASAFEGQIWVDTSSGNVTKQYKNGSFETITPSITDLRSRQLQILQSVNENAWNSRAAQENYDEVLTDDFFNSEKVSSTSGGASIVSQDTVTDNANWGVSSTNGSSNLSADVTFNDGEGWVSEVTVANSGGSDDFITCEIKDGSSNTLASKTTSSKVGSNADHTFTFTKSDYSRVPSDETVTVTCSNSNGLKETDGAPNSPSGSFYTTSPGSSTFASTSGSSVAELELSNGGKDAADAKGGTGTVTSTTKNLGFTPSKVILEGQVDRTGNKADFIIEDGSGNSLTLTSSDFGTEKSVSFADGNVNMKLDLDDAIIDEYAVMFV